MITRTIKALAVIGVLGAGAVSLPSPANADVAAPYPGTIEMKTGKPMSRWSRASPMR